MGSYMEIFDARFWGKILVFGWKTPILIIVSSLRVNLRDLHVGFEILLFLSRTLKNYCWN